MADVRLEKPEAGSHITIESPDEANFIFAFPMEQGTLAKDGENLTINFEDGASLNLEGFYSKYSQENLPQFNIEGETVAAADFFNAMNEPDLMPAAGPGAGAGAAAGVAGGGRYQDYGNSDLLGGLQHLDGLDWGMSRSFEHEENLNSVGVQHDSDGWWAGAAQPGINHPVTVEPENPGTVPPTTPDLPIPGQPEAPGNSGPAAERDILRAYEKDLADGQPVIKGGMTVTAPDGVDTITVGGVVIWENGAIVDGAEVRTDEGVLNNFQYDPDTGKLTYDFVLERPTQEHGQPGEDHISHSIPVTVTDVDGDTDTKHITIVIQDDVPQAFPDFNELKEGETVSASVVLGINGSGTDTWGQDGPGAFNENGEFDPDGSIAVKWNVPEGTPHQAGPDGKGFYEVETPLGSAKLYDDGTYEFTANPEIEGLTPGSTPPQISFGYSIVDKDGDISESTLTITINPAPDTPRPNNPVDVTPDHPDTPDPDNPNPDNPNNPDHPDNPANPEDKTPEDKPGDPDDPDNPFVPNPGTDVDQSVVWVKESDLRGGESVTVQESLTVNAPDGVATIVIGGKTIFENGSLVPVEDRTIETDEGHLVITGFDPDTGRLTYEFTLTNPTTEHGKPGTDNISHTFQVTVTDTDGDTGSSYITVVVKDDVPEARPDSGTVKEGESISANVIVNDDYNADGAGSFNEKGEFDPEGSIAVKWDVPADTEHQTGADGRGFYEVTTEQGTARLYDDGTYEFTASENAPGVAGDRNGQVEFNYSIVDKDGDVSNSTLTITITPENHTPDITPDPSYPDPDPTPDPDNPDKPVDPEDPDKPNDREPVQPDADGVRVIVDEADLPNGGGSGDSAHGASGKGSFQINLHGENGKATLSFTNADGKIETVEFELINNSTGKVEFSPAVFTLANGVKISMTDAVQNGSDGPWTVHFDYALTGSQTHANPNAVGADDVINSYIRVDVMDETGDRAQSQISVTVHDDGPAFAVEATGSRTDLDGDFQLNYGADNAAATGALTAAGALGTEVKGNDTIFTFEDGTLTITNNGNGQFSYAFAPKDGNTFSRDITLTARDSDGDTDTITLTVGKNYTPDITPDPGKDPDPDPNPTPDPDDPVNPAVSVGNVVVDEALLPDGSGKGDGHAISGSKTFTVDLHGEDGSIVLGHGSQTITLTVENGQISQTGSSMTVNGVLITVTGAEMVDGQWQISYDYQLTDNIAHDKAGLVGADDAMRDHISITVTDQDGSTANAVLNVTVHDDGPAFDVEATGTKTTLDGSFELNYGADHAATTGALTVAGALSSEVKGNATIFTFEDGTLTITNNGNGQFSYAFEPKDTNTTFSKDIQLTASDSDGDTDVITLTVGSNYTPDITPGPDPDPDPDPDPTPDPDDPANPALSVGNVVVDEALMPDGSGNGDGHATSGKAHFTVDLHGEDGSIVLGGKAVSIIVKDGKASIDGANTVAVNNVLLTITGVEMVDGQWQVNYTYELTDNVAHSRPDLVGAEDASRDHLAIKVTDQDGSTANAVLNVTVHDDGPAFAVEAAGSRTDLDGDFQLNYGADHAAATGALTAAGALGTEVKGNATIFTFEDGTLTITNNGNGQFSYAFAPKDGNTFSKDITLTARDSDGDTDTITLTVGKNYTPDITPGPDPDPDPDPDPTPDPDDPANPALSVGNVVVDEAFLPDGSGKGDGHAISGSKTFTVDLHGEDGSIVLGHGSQTITLTVENGQISQTGSSMTVNGVLIIVAGAEMVDGKWEVCYKYELVDNIAHDKAGLTGADDAMRDHISITVTDQDGSTANAVLNVTVHDDGPGFDVEATGTKTTLDGGFELNYGADHAAATGALTAAGALGTEVKGNATIFTFEDGTLTITNNGNGQFSYAFAPKDTNTTFSKDIQLTARDSDGDTDVITVTVGKNYTPDIIPGPDPDHPELGVTADRIAVDEGSQPQHGAEGHNGGSSSFVVDLHGETGTIQVGGVNGITLVIGENGLVPNAGTVTTANGVTLSGFTASASNGKWTISYDYAYTVDKGQQHGAPESATDSSVQNVVPIVVIDSNNDTAQGNIRVEVHDDVPLFSVESVGTNVTVDGEFGLNFGADGASRTGALTIDGKEGTPNAEGNLVFDVEGGQLILVDKGNGEYSYIYDRTDGQTAYKEEFELVAKDGDQDIDTIKILVGTNFTPDLIKDPNPSQEDPDNNAPDLQISQVTVDEALLNYGDIKGSHAGNLTENGAKADAKFFFDTHGEGGKLTFSFGDNSVEIEVDGDGNALAGTFPMEITTNFGKFTINGVQAANGEEGNTQGVVNYTYELTGPYTPIDQKENDGALTELGKNLGEKINVTLVDNFHTGDEPDSTSGIIHLNIKDDIDIINPTKPEDIEQGITSGHSQTILNFVVDGNLTTNEHFAGLSGAEQKWTFPRGNARPSMGVVNNVELFSSTVRFYYDEANGWSVDELKDAYGQSVSFGDDKDTSTNIGGRQNFVLSKDGLGIDYTGNHLASGGITNKSDWGDAQIGTSNRLSGSSYASEAVVLENTNHSASYGMKIDLGHFDQGDRAVIAFYLTPQNSNDDNIVLLKEIVWGEKDDNGNTIDGSQPIYINVPDGYTKAIVAAAPHGNSREEMSNFTIKQVELTRPAFEQSGQLELINGADSNAYGEHQGELTWNWSAIKEAMNGGIKLQGSMYDGDYTIEWSESGNSITAKLTGNTDSPSYNGTTLFTATLDQQGNWNVKQFFDFVLKNGKEPQFDVSISITDSDGDVTSVDQHIDMSQDSLKDRFQEVLDGYFNTKNWGSNAQNNKVVDVLAGSDENSLINGLGGNDVLIGDGGDQAILDIEDVLLGESSKLGSNIKVYDNNEDIAAGAEGNNKAFHDKLWTKLNSLSDKQLDDKMAELEAKEGAGGDDALLGGLGNDILFGGAGDDYLVGNGLDAHVSTKDRHDDHDMLFGGSGNDIILYDDKYSMQLGHKGDEPLRGDNIIHGGSGIDVLLVGSNTDESLAHLMSSQNHSGTRIRSIEVMLKTNGTAHAENLGVTSLATLAQNAGVTIDSTTHTMTLDMSKWDAKGTSDGNLKYVSKDGKLTLETTLKNPATDGKGNLVFTDPTAGVARANSRMGMENVAAGLGTLTALAVSGNQAEAAFHENMPNADSQEAAEDMTLVQGVISDTSEGQMLFASLDESEEPMPLAQEGEAQVTALNADMLLSDADTLQENEIVETVSLNGRVEAVETQTVEAGAEDLVSTVADEQSGEEASAIIGTDSAETIFGSDGDDFIDGKGGADTIFAGSGNDIIVYDASDKLIDGGSGIDFLITDEEAPNSLADMLENFANHGKDADMPMVNDVEVMIKGIDNADSLTNMGEMAARYGINLTKDADGNDVMTLDKSKWVQGEDNGRTTTWEFVEDSSVTLETTMQQDTSASTDQQAVLQMQVQSESGSM